MRAEAIFDMSGTVALVTGASSGLGARFATVLAANGARVALAGRRRQELDRVAAAIADAGGVSIVTPFDLKHPDRIPEVFDEIETAFGPIDLLVNNAGISSSGAVATLSFDDWREILDVNLDSLFLMAREAARRMKPGSRIVNVSSILALRPRAEMAAYSAAKAGVSQLSRIMALELADKGIRVNTLAPGYVVTGMNRDFFASEASQPLVDEIPLLRVGQVEDFDGAILLLASHGSDFMTGATLVIDGGHVLVL
ncbi:MAG: SDR family oxidoreductase [Hyphomicrobiales bacterium]|nr:SDR family oxidoreductase [Hyphomicrobiales bacterium]